MIQSQLFGEAGEVQCGRGGQLVRDAHSGQLLRVLPLPTSPALSILKILSTFEDF